MAVAFRAVSSATGTDATADGTIPSGTTTGDFMVAFVVAAASSTTVSTPPSGWTLQEADPNPADYSLWCYVRAWQSGDANPTWTLSAAGGWTVDIASYSGVDSTTPVNVDIGEIIAGANAIALGDITPSAPDCMLVAFASVDATGGARTWTETGSMTERVEATDNAMHRVLADELLSGGSGTPVGRTLTVTGSVQDIGGFLLALAPAAGGTTPVSTTRSTTWDVLAQVSAAKVASWDTRAEVSASRVASYDVLATVSASRAASWDTRAEVAASRAVSWDVLATVSAARVASWDTLALVEATRSTTWNVLSSLIAVSTTRVASWNVRAQVSASRVATWDTRAAVATTRAATWRVLAAITAVRTASWRTLATATASRVASWRTVATVAATRTATWNVSSDVIIVTPLERLYAVETESRTATVAAESRSATVLPQSRAATVPAESRTTEVS